MSGSENIGSRSIDASQRHPGLAGQLARLGFAAGGRARGSGLRFVALVAATASVALTLLVAVASLAVYDARVQRDQARQPTVVQDRADAVAWWWVANGKTGQLPHMVTWVDPIDIHDVPPPPGLDRWPAPGEAFVSPGLMAAGADEHIRSRYGEFAGVIGPAGLASPSERLAIARPAESNPTGMLISGFGSSYNPLGEALTARPLGQFLAAALFPLGVSAGILTMVAARTGSGPRERRLRLLSALGAKRRHRIVFSLAEGVVPVGLGGLLGFASYGVCMLTGLRVPLTGYLVAAGDLRQYWWPALGASLTAVAVVLVAVLVLHTGKRAARITGLRYSVERVPHWRAGAFVVALALTVASAYLRGLIGDPLGGYAAVLSLLAGLGLSWWMLPSVLALGAHQTGGWLAERGRGGRRGWRAANLVSGRWLAAHPGPAVRLTVAVVVGLGLLTQVQVFSSRLEGTPAPEAQAAYARLGDRFLTVDVDDAEPDHVEAFVRSLPDGVGIIEATQAGKHPKLRAKCPTWQLLDVECAGGHDQLRPGAGNDLADATLAATTFGSYARNGGGPRAAIGVGQPVLTGADTLVLITPESANVPLWRIQRATYRTLQTDPRHLGESSLTADRDRATADWMRLFGYAGIVIVLLAGMVSAMAEFLVFAVRLAPITVLTGRRRIYGRVAALTITAPMLVMTLAGTILAGWQGAFTIASFQDGAFSLNTLTVGAVAAAVAAIVTGVIGARQLHQHARRWRPVTE